MRFFNIFGQDDDPSKAMQVESGAVGLSPQAQSVWFSQQDNSQFGPLNPATPEETAMKRESDRIKSNDEQIMSNLGKQLAAIDESYKTPVSAEAPRLALGGDAEALREEAGYGMTLRYANAQRATTTAPKQQAATETARWDRQAALDFEARYGRLRNEEDRVRLGMERSQAMRDQQMASSNAPTAMLTEAALEIRAARRFGSLKLRAEAKAKVSEFESRTPRVSGVNLGLYDDASMFPAQADQKQFGKDTRMFMGEIKQRSEEVGKITSKEDLENFGNTLQGSEDPKKKAALATALSETLKYARPELYAEIAQTRQIQKVNEASMADWYRIQVDPEDKRTNAEIAAQVKKNEGGEMDRFAQEFGKLQDRQGRDVYITPPELQISLPKEQGEMPYTKVITTESGVQRSVQTTYGDEIGELKRQRLYINDLPPQQRATALRSNKEAIERIVTEAERNTKAVNVKLRTTSGSREVLESTDTTPAAKVAAMKNVARNLGEENSGYIYSGQVSQAEPDVDMIVKASGVVKPGAASAIVKRVSDQAIIRSMMEEIKPELVGKVLNQEQINAAMTKVATKVLKDNNESLSAYDKDSAAEFVKDIIGQAKEAFAKEATPALEEADKKAYEINFAAPVNQAIQTARATMLEPDEKIDKSFEVLKYNPAMQSDNATDLGLAYFESKVQGFSVLADQIREGGQSVLQNEDFAALKRSVDAVGTKMLEAKQRWEVKEYEANTKTIKDNTEKYGNPYLLTQSVKIPSGNEEQWLAGIDDQIGPAWSNATDPNSNVGKGDRVYHNPILRQLGDTLHGVYDTQTANDIINNLMPSTIDGLVGGNLKPDDMRILASYGKSLEQIGLQNYDQTVSGATLNYKDVEDQSFLQASKGFDEALAKSAEKNKGRDVSRDPIHVPLPENDLINKAMESNPTLKRMWQGAVSKGNEALAKTALRIARQRVLESNQMEHYFPNVSKIQDGIQRARGLKAGDVVIGALDEDGIKALADEGMNLEVAIQKLEGTKKSLAELSPTDNNVDEIVAGGKQAINQYTEIKKTHRAQRFVGFIKDQVIPFVKISLPQIQLGEHVKGLTEDVQSILDGTWREEANERLRGGKAGKIIEKLGDYLMDKSPEVWDKVKGEFNYYKREFERN